jgi:hypothetical protein
VLPSGTWSFWPLMVTFNMEAPPDSLRCVSRVRVPCPAARGSR